MSNTVLPGIISSGEVFGPASSTSGNLASFSGTTGTVIADSGKAAASVVLGAASVVAGNVASYNGTTGKLLADSGKVAADLVTGPASVTTGRLASYNGTTGKIIADSGKLAADVVTGAASVAAGNIASYNGTTGKVLADSGYPASALANLVPVFEVLAPTEGGTVTLSNSTNIALITPASGLTAATLQLPGGPYDTMKVTLCGVSNAIAGVTIDGNGATVLGAITSLSVDGFASYIYRLANTTWYRIG